MTLPTAAAPAQIAVTHTLLDAQGRVLSSDGPGRPHYAASTIKLHVLQAALRAAADGALDLAAEVPATRTFTGVDGARFTLDGDHLDPTHPADGTPIAVRDLLLRMIDRSSNEATNQVTELIGLPAVAATITALGLVSTRMQRLIGDGAALAQGLTNETSAADLAETMRVVVRGGDSIGLDRQDLALAEQGVGPAAPGVTRQGLALARDALRAQQIPVIGTVLRVGVEWGSKSGWVDGFRHDVAYIGDPEGADLRILAVMTAGLPAEVADQRITALARELLDSARG
ncbi:serine hydrolase [Brachybacterium paraconglomeratum]|uniref:serine hydrolase n=1 Tax=Brachybacterium paraconglomeratum TaxID=173362 RepID=UPI0031E691A0